MKCQACARKLKSLETYLNELYAGSSIIQNHKVTALEKEVFNLFGLDIKMIINKIDQTFLVDELTSFDRILTKINLTPVGNNKFSINYVID